MLNSQNQSILQAIESAEKNLALAKKLLGGEGISVPGIVGKFDGESIVTEKGQKHYVPPNYASKSRLVVGDTLRMIGQGEKALFKQIEKKERLKVAGVLTKKDGQWAAVAVEGSFFVLPVSVQYFKGEIGDEVEIMIPKDYKNTRPKWAALEQVAKPASPLRPKGTPSAAKALASKSAGQAAEAQKEAETRRKEGELVVPKFSKKPKQVRRPETPKTPKIPKTPGATKRSAIPLRPAVDGTSAGQAAEAQKEAETLKKVSLKQPKLSNKPKLRGEIKVEEELR